MYHNFLIHSSAEGHLGCFHVLAVANSATMNTGVCVSLSVLAKPGYLCLLLQLIWDTVYRKQSRASLVAQWWIISLPMQGTQVWSPIQENATCHGEAKPMSHNYSAHMLQLKPACPRACALQQEKPLKWEACAPQMDAVTTEKPAQQQRPSTTKNNLK